MTTKRDLTIVQGQDGDGILFPIVDDGEPKDVTGWQARSHIRHTPRGPLLDEFTCACGEDGVLVTWAGEQTAAWAWRTAKYDVELTDPEGQTFRIAEGEVTVNQEITHD